MIFKINFNFVLTLICVAVVHSDIKKCCHAASYINTDMATLEENGTTRTVSASVMIDFDNLFNMTDFTFGGMENGNDGATYTKTTATMRVLDSGEKEIVWNGIIVDTDRTGFATLVQSGDRNVIGTMTTDTTTYHLVAMPNGQIQLRAIDWVDAQALGFAVDDSTGTNDVNVDADGFYNIDHSGTMMYSEGTATAIEGPDNRRQLRGIRALQSGPTVDLLILITNRAMCEYAGLSYPCDLNDSNRAAIEGALPMIESQTNDSIQSVGGEATVRIVGVIYLSSSFDGRPTVSTLNVIRDSANVRQWRNEYGADLVAMLTGSEPGVGGIAYINSHESVTAVSQLQFFAFQHELAHNFGCLHDRANSQFTHPYGHGLQVSSSSFRTIMAYPCSSSRCPPIPYYSARGYTFQGTSIGDNTHDNARLIRENAPTVATWRATVNPPTVSPPAPTPTGNPPVSAPTTINSPTPPVNPPPTFNPPTPGGGGGGGGGFCFSGNNMVETQDRGIVSMDTVKIGDYVKDSADSYSRVYSYSHIDQSIDATYVQLRSEGIDLPLELSHDHMVYISSGKMMTAVRGGDVKIGNKLVGSDGMEHEVTSIDFVKRRGVYAPLTESGNIVVSGLMASSYVALLDYSASIQHSATHAVLSPLRLLCTMKFEICENETYTMDGLSNFIIHLIQLVRHVAEYSIYVQIILTATAAPVILTVYLLEQTLMMSPLSLLVMLISFIFLFCNKTKENKTNCH